MSNINGFWLFCNDSHSINGNAVSPYSDTAVYDKVPFAPGYSYSHNIRDIEFTRTKVISKPDITIATHLNPSCFTKSVVPMMYSGRSYAR